MVLRSRFSGAFCQPLRCNRLYTDASATWRPSCDSNALLISLTTKLWPVAAFLRNGSRNELSSSRLRFSRCLPPRVCSPVFSNRSPRIKALRSRQVQPTDRPMAREACATLSPNSNGRSTAWACRNCSTVFALAKQAFAFSRTSAPLALLATIAFPFECAINIT